MNEVRREVVGGIVTGAVMTAVGWLMPRVLGDTQAACDSLPGRLGQATDTGVAAKCYATDVALQFRPFILWCGLLVLVCFVAVALLAQRGGVWGATDDDVDPADPSPLESDHRIADTDGTTTDPHGAARPGAVPNEGLVPWRTEPPAMTVAPLVLARDTVRLLAAETSATEAGHATAVGEIDNLLDRQLRDLEQDDVLEAFWADPEDQGGREALVDAITQCADDDPDFARQLQAYVERCRAADPGS